MIPNVTFFTLSMVGVFPCFLTGRDFEDLARLGAWLKKRREKPDTAPASGLGQQVAQSHPAT